MVALEPGAASRVGGHVYSDGKSGTLRANAGDNQQAVVVAEPETYALQGSMIGRADKNGPQGDGINEDVCFTLNTSDRHAIAAPDPSFTISRDNHFAVSEDVSVTAVARGPATVAAPADHYCTSKNSHHTVAVHEQANTLVASDWKDPPLVNDLPNDEPVYIVRRLTPVECARLQGFPDWWCADLAIPDPSDEEIAFWIPINPESLYGCECYAGLDLSSTSDITAFVLVFPPLHEDDKYIVVPHFWLPRETLDLRVRRDHVPYDVWERMGLFHITEGNVVDYNFVRKTINELHTMYNIKEIAADRWNATQLITDLEGDGFTVVPMGMGFKDMSPPMKELYKLILEGQFIHGGNPVLRWMAGNVVAEIDAAENIKPSKKKSTEKIDGIVAWIMALDRCIRHEMQGSVYDEPDHDLVVI